MCKYQTAPLNKILSKLNKEIHVHTTITWLLSNIMIFMCLNHTKISIYFLTKIL